MVHATPLSRFLLVVRAAYLLHATLVAPLSGVDLIRTSTLGEVQAVGYRASGVFFMGRR